MTVTSYKHRGRSRPAARQRTAEELAALHAVALQWRETWRAEQARAAIEEANGPPIEPKRRQRNSGGAGFAAAIAREELGRFYWSAAQERRLREAMSIREARSHKRRD
jgi:hypothetical protein